MTSATSRVFIPDPEYVWVGAEVLTPLNEKSQVEVRIADDDVPFNHECRVISLQKTGLSSLPLQNVDIYGKGVDDMCTLSYLHEPGILENLRRRFMAKLPYTYTDNICIAVNPYSWLNIYTAELRNEYAAKKRVELPPHAYATSIDAYRGLSLKRRNQSILVSGESGAGKTETVKILMAHVTHVSSREGDTTVDKLLKANPLLESFGNAKTARNDNSSRFGKFSQLEFDTNYGLVGSRCITYLLEKSRVVGQSGLERNYHILYQILNAPEHIRTPLQLLDSSPMDFFYMNGGDTITNVIEGKSDEQRFQITSDALALLGVYGPTLSHLLEVLAGILFLGQISLCALDGDADTAALDKKSAPDIDDRVRKCCQMLGIDENGFLYAVVCRTIDVEGTKLPVPLTIEQAIAGRDALAKEIYFRIFQWLVLVINFNTVFRESIDSKLGGTISLLDIFGFECFAVNRFEQLCINFANEKLQQKFTQDVLKAVQIEYEEEGIQWDHVNFSDNQDVLEILEGKKGIIHFINEECLVPRGSDTSLVSKLKTAFSASSLFTVNPRARDQFTISHYAGKVQYTATGFMDRNKDTIPEDMRSLMVASTNPLLARIFGQAGHFTGQSSPEADELLKGSSRDAFAFLLLTSAPGVVSTIPPSPKGASPSISNDSTGSTSTSLISRRASASPGSASERNSTPRKSSFMMAETVTTKFKTQLSKLMEMIGATEVQYVRCIKPNTNKSSTEFSRLMVVEQLRSAGMIEAIRISRAAFPNRMTYADFLGRFTVLESKAWTNDLKKSLTDRGIKLPHPQMVEITKAIVAANVDYLMGIESSSTEAAAEIKNPPNVSTNTAPSSSKSASLTAARKSKIGTAAPPSSSSKAAASKTTASLGAAKKSTPASNFSSLFEKISRGYEKLFQFGRSKVYFSHGLVERLEILRTEALKDLVVLVQKVFRGFIKKIQFRIIKQYCVIAQSFIRMSLVRSKYMIIIRSAIALQCFVRVVRARRLVQKLRQIRASTRIQKTFRMHRVYVQYRIVRYAAIMIESLAKMYLQRKIFKILLIRYRKKCRALEQISGAYVRRKCKDVLANWIVRLKQKKLFAAHLKRLNLVQIHRTFSKWRLVYSDAMERKNMKPHPKSSVVPTLSDTVTIAHIADAKGFLPAAGLEPVKTLPPPLIHNIPNVSLNKEIAVAPTEKDIDGSRQLVKVIAQPAFKQSKPPPIQVENGVEPRKDEGQASSPAKIRKSPFKVDVPLLQLNFTGHNNDLICEEEPEVVNEDGPSKLPPAQGINSESNVPTESNPAMINAAMKKAVEIYKNKINSDKLLMQELQTKLNSLQEEVNASKTRENEAVEKLAATTSVDSISKISELQSRLNAAMATIAAMEFKYKEKNAALAKEIEKNGELEGKVVSLESQLKRHERLANAVSLEKKHLEDEIDGLRDDAATMKKAMKNSQLRILNRAGQSPINTEKDPSGSIFSKMFSFNSATKLPKDDPDNSFANENVGIMEVELERYKLKASSLEEALKIEKEKVALLKSLVESQNGKQEPPRDNSKAKDHSEEMSPRTVSKILTNLVAETSSLASLRKDMEFEREERKHSKSKFFPEAPPPPGSGSGSGSGPSLSSPRAPVLTLNSFLNAESGGLSQSHIQSLENSDGGRSLERPPSLLSVYSNISRGRPGGRRKSNAVQSFSDPPPAYPTPPPNPYQVYDDRESIYSEIENQSAIRPFGSQQLPMPPAGYGNYPPPLNSRNQDRGNPSDTMNPYNLQQGGNVVNAANIQNSDNWDVHQYGRRGGKSTANRENIIDVKRSNSMVLSSGQSNGFQQMEWQQQQLWHQQQQQQLVEQQQRIDQQRLQQQQQLIEQQRLERQQQEQLEQQRQQQVQMEQHQRLDQQRQQQQQQLIEQQRLDRQQHLEQQQRQQLQQQQMEQQQMEQQRRQVQQQQPHSGGDHFDRMIQSPEGWGARLFLLQKNNEIVEKPAIIRLFVAPSGSTEDGKFELELLAPPDSGETAKKLRFSISEMKSVKLGKGKRMVFDVPDSCCMCVGIKSKGELNIVFDTETERNAAVRIFSNRLDITVSAQSPVDTRASERAPEGRAPEGRAPDGSAPKDAVESARSHESNHTPRRHSIDSPRRAPSPRKVLKIDSPRISIKIDSPRRNIAKSEDFTASRLHGNPALPVATQPIVPPTQLAAADQINSNVGGSIAVNPTGHAGHSSPGFIVKAGWVLKEELKKNKSWAKKYMGLEAEGCTLRFANSPAAITFPKQIESVLRLTADMTVGKGVATWSTMDDASTQLQLEISDAKGLRLRVQLESARDQDQWIQAIQTVIRGLTKVES